MSCCTSFLFARKAFFGIGRLLVAKPGLNGKLVWESVIIAHYLAAGCFGLGFANDDCNGNTGML